MIFTKGGRKPVKSAAPSKILTLDSPKGWIPEDGALTDSAALNLSAFYCGVQYICDFVSSLPMYVWNGNARERVDDYKLNYLLTVRPNDYQSPSTWKRYMMRSVLLRGNAYAYIVRDPATARPKELLPLAADHMTVKLIENQLQYLYTMPRTGTLYAIDPEDVLHYLADGDNGYEGVSIVKYAAKTLQRAASADQYETAVYTNNARPGGILHTDADIGGYSEVPDPEHPGEFLTVKENIRRAWERAHGGGANAFRVAILDNGLKYEPIKLDAFDTSFVTAKDISVADIARFLGVPLHCLQAGKQSYSSNEQNALEFVQGRGMAIIRAIEEENSYKLLLDSELANSYRIKFNLDGRLRGDTAARAQYYKAMREVGAYSANDILRLEDKPDVEGGDVHYASLNYVPLEDFKELSLARNMTDKSMNTPD